MPSNQTDADWIPKYEDDEKSCETCGDKRCMMYGEESIGRSCWEPLKPAPITREEFNALVKRVDELEQSASRRTWVSVRERGDDS